MELSHRPLGEGSVDPVHSTAVESEPIQRRLQTGDVGSAEVGGTKEQDALAEAPSGLTETLPRLLVHPTGGGETLVHLEFHDGGPGAVAEHAVDGRCRSEEPRGDEMFLKFADVGSAVSRGQREAGRNGSSSCTMRDLGWAPTILCSTCPLRNTRMVGMLMTP